MINIVVIQNNQYISYEYISKSSFINLIEDDDKDIPHPDLDDILVEVHTDDKALQSWWRNTGGLTVNDLLSKCRECFV